MAEWATLEMSYTRKGIRGSNPLASADNIFHGSARLTMLSIAKDLSAETLVKEGNCQCARQTRY